MDSAEDEPAFADLDYNWNATLSDQPDDGQRTGADPLITMALIRVGLVGLAGVFAYNCFFWGLSLAPAIDGSIIVSVFSPVLTTLALLGADREAASTRPIVGLITGVLGAWVFFVGIGGGLTRSRLAGDVTCLVAAGCWAAYSITSMKVLSGMEPLRATTYATGVGALALIVVSVPAVSRVDWWEPRLRSVRI